MNSVLDWLVDIFFPNRCGFCSKIIPWNSLVCPECEENLETADFCPKCGKSNCECVKHYFNYDGCAVARPYAGTVRKGILALKYNNGFNTAKYLMPELMERVKRYGFLDESDIVTAVPMTSSRRRETGYNQAEYIAKLLAKRVGLSCDFKLISKAASAPTQHKLSAEERREAAKSVYIKGRSKADIKGKTVILCDDIITTGSTLSECAKVLKNMGAKTVYCAVLSGTVFESEGQKEG